MRSIKKHDYDKDYTKLELVVDKDIASLPLNEPEQRVLMLLRKLTFNGTVEAKNMTRAQGKALGYKEPVILAAQAKLIQEGYIEVFEDIVMKSNWNVDGVRLINNQIKINKKNETNPLF